MLMKSQCVLMYKQTKDQQLMKANQATRSLPCVLGYNEKWNQMEKQRCFHSFSSIYLINSKCTYTYTVACKINLSFNQLWPNEGNNLLINYIRLPFHHFSFNFQKEIKYIPNNDTNHLDRVTHGPCCCCCSTLFKPSPAHVA